MELEAEEGQDADKRRKGLASILDSCSIRVETDSVLSEREYQTMKEQCRDVEGISSAPAKKNIAKSNMTMSYKSRYFNFF